MSLLYRRQLNIVFGPGQLVLQRTAYKLTRKGPAIDVLGDEIIQSVPDDVAPWSGALQALGEALPHLAWRDMQATVVLSNHFVQYALVPWVGDLDDKDEMAYARHCFREVYGDAAEGWEIRVSWGDGVGPGLASAVDSAMLSNLREVLARAGVTTKSIQPQLMMAFNSSVASLNRRNAWLALLEPGSLCVAMLREGQFSSIRKLRIGDAWQEELPRVLEREAYLVDGAAEVHDVFLWAPQADCDSIPQTGRWNIQTLTPFPGRGLVAAAAGKRKGDGE